MRLTPSEHQIQTALIDYLSIAAKPDVYYFAVPNGGHRHMSVASKLKAEGVKRGVPDLCFLLPAGKTGWLEMKAKGGSVTPEQRAFGAMCKLLGHEFGVAKSIDEALGHLTSWDVLKPAYQRGEAFRKAAEIHLTMARAI